jgi:hypothetical protein
MSVELTEELAERALQYVRAGLAPEVACAAVDVPPSVLREWLQRGDATGTDPDDEPYRRFRDRLAVEEAKGEARLITLVQAAAAEAWQAAVWLLERRYPARWARISQRTPDGDERPADPTDPFMEVDELARRRQRHR